MARVALDGAGGRREVRRMKCPNCGKTSRIREKDRFCHNCGHSLKVSGAEKQENATIKIGCDMAEVIEAEKSAERLVGLLKEANALVGKLASKEIRLDFKIDI